MKIDHNEDLIINLYLNGLLDEEAERIIKDKIDSNEEFSKKVFTHVLLIKVQQDEELRTEIETGLGEFMKSFKHNENDYEPVDPGIKLREKFYKNLFAAAAAFVCLVIGWLFWPQTSQQELTLQRYEFESSGDNGNSMLLGIVNPTDKKIKIINDGKGKETFRFESDSVLHISLKSQQVGTFHENSRLIYFGQDSIYLYFDSNGWKLKGKKGKLDKLPEQ